MPAEPDSSRAELPRLARFEILRRVGEGGTGVVYEAIDRDRGARVALKMLRVLEPEMLLGLKAEFRALQDIEHPNLIRLFELTCEEETWFFTMELVRGWSFVAYVTGVDASRQPTRSLTRGPWVEDASGVPSGARPKGSTHPRVVDLARLRESLAQLARGLVALHAAGKVHRDIKPSNVLVASDGRVVILDFGLVRDSTMKATAEDDDLIVGTISHMAPEQAAGTDVGPAADWYSVGVILYQCLTGRAPFEGGAMDVLARKQVEEPAAPRALAPDAPEDLDALCVELLSRDPARRPVGAEVLRRLEGRGLSAHPPALTGTSDGAPFVGRVREMHALREAFARVEAGGSATVVVEGESGVGKSATVRRFLRGIEETGRALVLAGRCYEREDVPYKAVDGVIDALSSHLATLSPLAVQEVMPPAAFVVAHVFPVLRRVPAMSLTPAVQMGALQESRAILFAALRELFTNLARSAPLVLVIDDLQWADADSLALLAEILRPPSPPLFLLATSRPRSAEASKEAVPFGLPGDVRVLSLKRLTPDEGLELVTMLGSDIAPAVAERIASEAGGHPLFALELVRHAQFLGGVAPANVHLDEALVARVDRLDPDARALLELLAVGGVAMPQELAMRASGLEFAAFAMLAQTLRAAHLARTHGWRGEDAIEPYHDRVREAVAGRLDPETRKRAHARIARALEDSRTLDYDALSSHWLGAGDEAKAGSHARDAAEQAMGSLAFERAARLYERALRLAPLDADGAQALRIKLGDALANAGHGAEAARAYSEAAAHAAPERALDLRRRAAEELLIAGRIDEGDEAVKRVLDAVSIGFPRTPLVALLGLLWFRFVLLARGLRFRERAEKDIPPHALTRIDACNGAGGILSLVDTIRGSYFTTRGLLMALALGEPSRLSYALSADAAYSAAQGDAARSAKLVSQATALADRIGDVQMQALAETSSGFALFLDGRFADGLVRSDRGEKMLAEKCPGAFWHRRTAQLASIWMVGWMGQLNELAGRVEPGVREADQRGDLYVGTCLRTGVPSLTWLRKGDGSAARAIVLDATRQWTQRGYHSQHYWALLALARIDLYEGDGRAAHARVTREWSRITRALILQVKLMALEALHLRASSALAAAGESDESERAGLVRVAERDAVRIDRMRWRLATPFGHMIRAGVAMLRGDAGRAEGELESSARGFDDVAMRLHAASSRWHLGRLRGGDEGGALVASAEEWMTSQGIASAARMAGMIAPGFRR